MDRGCIEVLRWGKGSKISFFPIIWGYFFCVLWGAQLIIIMTDISQDDLDLIPPWHLSLTHIELKEVRWYL